MQRVVDLASGHTMVVSDLHGDQDAFARYTGRFLQLRSRGRAQRLLLLGDLIHSNEPEDADSSLQIVTDIMRLQATLGADACIALLGNHEMAHIYSLLLARGSFEYTPRFERVLSASGKRAEILNFFQAMPFYVRTAAGVSFTHAGPDGRAMAGFKALATFDHQALLDEYTRRLDAMDANERAAYRDEYARTTREGLDYAMLAAARIAVSGPDDPRYDDLLRGFMLANRSMEFETLYDAVFMRAEMTMPSTLYERLLRRFLETLSEDAPTPQRVLVTGHMDVEGGHKVVTRAHLRLASAKHATPREAGQYLLFDAAQPVADAPALVAALGSVFV